MKFQAVGTNAQVVGYESGRVSAEKAPAREVSLGGMLLLAALGVVLAIMGVVMLGLAMMGVIWLVGQVPHAAYAVLARLQG
jgi:hypothetical protein